jgi:hypothetical protein
MLRCAADRAALQRLTDTGRRKSAPQAALGPTSPAFSGLHLGHWGLYSAAMVLTALASAIMR